MMLYFIPLTLLLTFFALGGVHSYHTTGFFTLMLFLWMIEYGCQVRYGMKRIFKTNIELPVIVALLYGTGLLLYYQFFPDVDSRFKPFYQLWAQLGIKEHTAEISGRVDLWIGVVALLNIGIFYLWFKWLLNFKKTIFKLKSIFLILYMIPILSYLFDLFPGAIWGSHTTHFSGFFVNPNHLASFLSIPLPVVIYYFFLRRKHLPWDLGLLRVVLVVIPIIIMVQLNGRMALFSTAIVIILYLWSNKHSINPLFSVMLAVLMIGGVISIFITKSIVSDTDFSTLFQIQNLLIEDSHWDILKGSLSLFQTYWLTGIGPGQFPLLYSTVNPGDLVFVHHLHNEYGQFILEFGVVGILCMIWFYYHLIETIIYGFRKLQGDYRGLFKAIVASLLLFHIQVFTSYQLHLISFILLFGLLIAMLYILIYHYHRFYTTNDERRNL